MKKSERRRRKKEKLKGLRKSAHHYFDVLWLYKLYNSGKNVSYWRKKQYKWLSQKLNIPPEKCHMSSMNKEELENVIDICADELNKNEKILEFADQLDKGMINKLKWFKID